MLESLSVVDILMTGIFIMAISYIILNKNNEENYEDMSNSNLPISQDKPNDIIATVKPDIVNNNDIVCVKKSILEDLEKKAAAPPKVITKIVNKPCNSNNGGSWYDEDPADYYKLIYKPVRAFMGDKLLNSYNIAEFNNTATSKIGGRIELNSKYMYPKPSGTININKK